MPITNGGFQMMEVAAAAEAGMRVQLHCFEGLLNAFQPTLEHLEALRRAGFDAEQPRWEYPVAVWREALEISRVQLFPDLSPQQGFRQLGVRIIPGLAASLVGKVVVAAMVGVNIEGMLRRLPTFVAIARPGLRMDVWAESENRWRAQVIDPAALPDFVAGVIDGTLQYRKLPVEVRVDWLVPGGYELVFTW